MFANLGEVDRMSPEERASYEALRQRKRKLDELKAAAAVAQEQEQDMLGGAYGDGGASSF